MAIDLLEVILVEPNSRSTENMNLPPKKGQTMSKFQDWGHFLLDWEKLT